MNLSNRKFINIQTGKTVEVDDSFEDLAVLKDGTKISVSRLLDKSYYDDFIDPKSFFNNDNLLSNFAQKIRQIPDTVVNKMDETLTESSNNSRSEMMPDMNESAVLPYDPEIEKEELMRKYSINDNTSINALNNQMMLMKDIIDDDDDIVKVDIDRNVNGETLVEEHHTVSHNNPIREIEDPIISMFKNVKCNTDFSFNLLINDKIPRSDFIEMMEDSYNTSIIDYFAYEFTNKILENPSLIKDKIKEEINKIVYGSNKSSKSIEDAKSNNTSESSAKPKTRISKKVTSSK